MERCHARREPYSGSRYADLEKRAWKSSTATRTGKLHIVGIESRHFPETNP